MRVAAGVMLASMMAVAAADGTSAPEWYEQAMLQAAQLEPTTIDDLTMPDWDIDAALASGEPSLPESLPDAITEHHKGVGRFKDAFLEAERNGDAELMRSLVSDRLLGYEEGIAAGHSGVYVSGLHSIYRFLLTENEGNRLRICRDTIDAHLHDARVRALWARMLPALITQLRIDVDTLREGVFPHHWQDPAAFGDERQRIVRMLTDDPHEVLDAVEAAYAHAAKHAMLRFDRCPTAWDSTYERDDSLPLPADLMSSMLWVEGGSYWRARATAYILREAAALAAGEPGGRDDCLGELVQVEWVEEGVRVTPADLPALNAARHPMQGRLDFLRHPTPFADGYEIDCEALLEALEERRAKIRAQQE